MNPRELIILVLGLAIVAVVLRGLYVAMQARRGQIRLAIDKNIPQDIDLDALELAELPGGGARVVERSLDSVNQHNSRLDAAQERAAALNLGSTDSPEDNIPVLMDAINLSDNEPDQDTLDDDDDWDSETSEPVPLQPEPIREEDYPLSGSVPETEMAEEQESDYPDERTAPVFNEDLASDLANEPQETEEDQLSESDDVLLDYGSETDDSEDDWVDDSIDPMARLAPDYPDDDSVTHDSEIEGSDIESESPVERDQYSEVHDDGNDGSLEVDDEVEEDVSSLDSEEDSYFRQELDSDEREEVESEPPQSFEDQLDDFSLSAGERIGYDETRQEKLVSSSTNESPHDQESAAIEQQSSLFDEAQEASAAEPQENEATGVSKASRFFSAFKRKPKPEAPVADDSGKAVERELVESPAEPDLTSHEIESAPPLVQGSDTTVDEPQQKEEVPTQPTEVLVINVMAREGYHFAGDDLLQVLITAGLKFGEMNIFHHRMEINGTNSVLFSVANVLNPGTFDLNNMSNFSTLGVSFFLALPTSINNLDAFETMLSVAQQVKAGLDGELKDDHRNVMTAQTIEHYRQRVRDFELRQLKAAGGRS